MGSVWPKVTAVIAVSLMIGAGLGAGAYAVFDSHGGNTTIVRQVTVRQAVETAATAGKPLSVGSIYKLANRGVVKITVTSNGSSLFPTNGRTERSQGSGFVYDSAGHVVTNQHVVDGASSIEVQFWNGRTYPATVVGSDPSTDTAVIKVNAPASVFHALDLGNSASVAVGDNVVAMGSPFGLAETVTAGIVSAIHREMTSPNNFTIDDSIQTDAAINHGNSGGPLLDEEGRVIGINTQIESDSGGNDGVGFAVPSNTIRAIAAKLIATGKVEHAYLGVSLETAHGGGAKITDVKSGTPAARAGLKKGDVIKRFGLTPVDTEETLRHAVDAKKPGDTATVVFLRGDKSRTVTVTLASRPS